ncbi:unnamed protein product [Protopolystoma xenopodis]|uniref:Prenylcysteine lyase domain-containing protein n=1 Tax=Protopolystoma xenopodis TaxID=117903 RepID=A0A3S5B8D7_9PLAT|nr:unnamed protein product [Protopolystoma xenopodis]
MNVPVKPIDRWSRGIRRRLLVELTLESLHQTLLLEMEVTSLRDLGTFILAPGLIYANALESAFSTMETAAVGGRNAALLVSHKRLRNSSDFTNINTQRRPSLRPLLDPVALSQQKPF